MKKIIKISSLVLGLFLVAAPAWAEVSMSPSVVRMGASGNFTLGVTSENGLTTTMVRLQIPQNVADVRPNVKPGWATEFEVSESGLFLVWKGGLIPPGQRDDFIFSATVPAEAGELAWQIFQTYEDGSVISWSMDPRAVPAGYLGPERTALGAYPVTRVVDDLSATAANQLAIWSDPQITFVLSLLALIFSLISFYSHPNHPLIRSGRKRK